MFVPGVLIGWASGLKDFGLIAIAPALTVSTVSVAAIAAPMLGISWSLAPVLALTILVAAVALLVSRASNRKTPERKPSMSWRLPAGELMAVLVAAFLVGRRLIFVFGQPDAFSQTFDNVFHLNAIRYILDTGSASSFSIAGMTGGAGFYPAAWHDMVSLLVTITAAQIPVAVNVVNIIVGAIVWPVGCIFLVQQIVGRKLLASLIAGILAAAFGAFPILMMDFGVLYPLALGISLLPVAIGICLHILGKSQAQPVPKLVSWMLLVAVLPGLSLAHTSCVMALAIIVVPVLLGLWWGKVHSTVKRLPSKKGALSLQMVGLLAAVAVFLVAWKYVRPAEVASFWPPFQTVGRAVGEVVTSSAIGRPVAWIVAILALVGLASLVNRRHQLWMVGMYLVVGWLYVVASAMPFGGLRTFITGVWYNDPPRLAALLPVVILPVAVIGGLRIIEVARVRIGSAFLALLDRRRHIKREGLGERQYIGNAFVGLLLIGLAVGTQQANVREAAISAAPGYQTTAASPLLSLDELTLIKRLNKEVPPDAVLLGNPWTGSALAYALADRKTLQLHILSAVPKGGDELYDHLNDAKSDPGICPVVRELGAQYVLDFGHQEVHSGDHGFRGLDDLDGMGVGTLIDHQGDAKLYKITACE
jgi:hypothetical protein